VCNGHPTTYLLPTHTEEEEEEEEVTQINKMEHGSDGMCLGVCIGWMIR
jgi:hypothetical protein